MKKMKGIRLLNKHNLVIASPIGKLGIVITSGKIAKISFLPPQTTLVFPKNTVERRIVARIKHYFCNPKSNLYLLISIQGTPLQKKIWQALQKIPVGKTITYGKLAKKLKTSPRVIGNACRLNPVPIIVPCHRVIAVSGLGGYCGKKNDTIKMKKWLLAHENKNPSF